jgi:TonB-dependent SusC/RagA subfamily outer membrane receptor
MKKTLLVLFLAVFCCMANLFAQTVTVKGTVVAADDGYPLPGVTVKVKNTPKVTATDANGVYTISASVGQTLVFTYIGTVTQEKIIGAQTTINISLVQDTHSLKEVMVTGAFGVKQSQRDLTSPVQTVKGSDIQQTQRENFLNALQGRIAGATVTSTSGAPGASSQIVLRGYNSIGGSNSPLFVVDGVRVSNDAVDQQLLASNGPNRSADFTNRIADINSDDIESITVLKGADAAAVYGSSASGGAIVITTKKGHAGNGALTYDNSFGFANAYRFPQIQNVFGIGTNGATSIAVRTGFGPAYAAGTQTFDNLKNIMQTGKTITNNIAFEGGNDQSSYRVSAQIRHATGVLPVAYNDKVSLFFSGQSKLTSKLTSSATFNYFNIDNRKLNKGNSGTYIDALTWPTYDDVRNYANPDGTKRTLIPATASLADNSIDFDNPLWDANKNVSEDKTNRIKASADLSFDATPWLNFRGILGVDFASTGGNNYVSQTSSAYQNSPVNGFAAATGIASNGIIDNYNDNNLQINSNVFATVKKTFGDFRSTLRVGAEIINNSDDVNGFYGQNFSQPDFNSINNTDPTKQRNSDYLKRVRYASGIASLGLV